LIQDVRKKERRTTRTLD